MSTKTKTKIGMLNPTFVPIESEPENAKPVYKAATAEVSLGHGVRADLSVETVELRVYGDDALQISADLFKKGNLDTEALLDDLEQEAALYGSTVGEDGSVEDGEDDASPPGAVYYYQKLMKKDKSIVYRAVILWRAEANRANYTDNSDTKGENLEPKAHPVGFNLYLANHNKWRWRKEFSTYDAAVAAVAAQLHGTAAGT